jgi:hypothetical protein
MRIASFHLGILTVSSSNTPFSACRWHAAQLAAEPTDLCAQAVRGTSSCFFTNQRV